MRHCVAGGVRPAHDLTTAVHGDGAAKRAAQGAEIDHPAARRPRECVASGVTACAGFAHHLTPAVHGE